MIIDPTYLNILRQIYTRLKDSNINWVVTGSSGFALQNVPVTPQDIDLLCLWAASMSMNITWPGC